jgi:HEAT repeat protein
MSPLEALRARAIAVWRRILPKSSTGHVPDDDQIVKIAQNEDRRCDMERQARYGNSPEVRADAVVALFLSDQTAAIETSKRLLGDPNAVVRKAAEDVLVGSGSCPRSGLDALREDLRKASATKGPKADSEDGGRFYENYDWWSGGKV